MSRRAQVGTVSFLLTLVWAGGLLAAFDDRLPFTLTRGTAR